MVEPVSQFLRLVVVEPVSPLSRAGCGRAYVAVLTGWLWQSLRRRSHGLVVVEPVSQFLRLVVVEPVSPFSRAGCDRACVAVLTGWLL